jgi:hypothetical protein
MLNRIGRVLLLVLVAQLSSVVGSAATRNLGSLTRMTGEQMQWHKLSLTFAGPAATESQSVNPFRNYRLDATFKHAASGRVVRVPGYFAADGNAHNTSATSGNQWRVNFAPDATGTWTYVISFRTGTDVAVADSLSAGTATSFNGESGSFTVDPTNKTGADFRAKGRLQEVGQHYLQHLGSKEYFIKAGAGSPENFLAYADFDNTTAGKKPLHYYSPHLTHYRSGDVTWKSGKGKAIIGALNYLAGKKMNSLYFLTMNVGGDGDDVFPWITKSERYRFDVSKLAQWEMVFEHMDKLGIHLNIFTQERENDQLLDGGSLGIQRKLYYRELVARFGHHLGVTWNLGEENTNTAAQRDAFADHFNALDPYLHMIAVHTYPSERDSIYAPMVSHPVISGASLQLQSPSIVHAETLKWVKKSADSGQKWVVTLDEVGSASIGVKPDVNDPNHGEILHRALWGSLMAGAAGVEWYFGYDYAHHDLTCEDWTSRDKMWTLTQYAAQFFRDYMPLPLVANYNSITSSSSDYCFGKPGVAYAIYLPAGATTTITLPAGQNYGVRWFNPRHGGALQAGTVGTVKGGAAASVGKPPSETSLDWVALLRRSDDASGGAQPPPTAPLTMSVSKLMLVNTSTQDDLRALTNGSVIDLSKDGSSLNVRADTTGTIGSVVFYLNGKKYHDESAAPYALGRDDAGVYRKWTPSIGTHTLKAVPYSGIKGGGAVGIPVEVTFTVVKASVTAPSSAVTKLVLVNATTQRDLRELTNGTTIDLSQDGSALNIRADISGSVGSVGFAWNGANTATENTPVYAFAMDDSGVYRKWKPSVGTHVLRAVPYSQDNRGGSAGAAMEITVKVVN